VRGSPIRTSSDQRSVGSSPRLNAASHVLHRLLVPRHPPCALNNLTTQKSRTLAPGRKRLCGPTRTLVTESEDARVHCAVLNVRPVTIHVIPPVPQGPSGLRRYEMQDGPDDEVERFPVPSGPNSVPTTRTPPRPPRSTPRGAVLAAPDRAGRTGQRSTLEHHPEHPAARSQMSGRSRSGRGSGPAASSWPARCSLERR
jgi:hypothetical protein